MTHRPDAHEQLVNSFTYHPPKGNQVERYEALRAAYLEMGERIAQLCPESRERSLAITNLEQSCMWANKSIACNE